MKNTSFEDLAVREPIRALPNTLERRQRWRETLFTRFLQSRLGQSWDKIFSEVCRSPKWRKWRKEIKSFVGCGNPDCWQEFYVDNQGILQRIKRKNKCSVKKNRQKNLRTLPNGEVAKKIKGVWYSFKIRPLSLWERELAGLPNPKDLKRSKSSFLRNFKFSPIIGYIFWHKGDWQTVVSKKQLGKRLIKSYRLRS